MRILGFTIGHKRPAGRVHSMRQSGMQGYYPTWEKRAQPGYGDAPQWAYTTLALKPRNASNGYAVPMATLVEQPPQVMNVQNVRLDGYGTPAGTMALTALYNPAANLAPLAKG